MLDINPSSVRQWSRLGSRAMFGQSILALAENLSNLMVLSADLGKSSGLDRFAAAYPEQFINTGIAEQNMIGVAAGLAKEGFVPFATSFAPFIAMRACEQIRMNMGYMQMNVKAVAIGSGLAMGFLGNSHYGTEDLAVIRSIPNLTVIAPADCAEILKVVYAAAAHEGPVYIRLTGSINTPIVYSADYDFSIGQAIQLRTGTDVSIIAHGSMVHEALLAAKLLEEKNVSVSVWNMHTVKPLDGNALEQCYSHSKLVVTVEEHSVIGGLGSAVAEHRSLYAAAPPLLRLGLPDQYGVTADYRYLLEYYGLVGSGIGSAVLSFLDGSKTNTVLS